MEQQNPQTPDSKSSTFVNCLGCEKLVRLPAEPDPNAFARCPRCGETFQIGELLDPDIPDLEVIDAGDSPGTSTVPFPVQDKTGDSSVGPEEIKVDDQNPFTVPAALSKGARRKKRRRKSSERESRSSQSGEKIDEFASVTEETKADPDEFASLEKPNSERSRSSSSNSSSRGSSSSSRGSSSRRSSSSSSRSRKKSSSPSGEIEAFKVLLGALLAPPVAQLVIWWGLGLDPVKMGPSVARFVPVVVPAKFHGDDDDELKADQDKSL